jgi:hypothetical protein
MFKKLNDWSYAIINSEGQKNGELHRWCNEDEWVWDMAACEHSIDWSFDVADLKVIVAKLEELNKEVKS